MIIGRVIDEMVATQKMEPFQGQKLLLVQPQDLQQKDMDEAVLAIDGADAGIGDQVLLVQDGFAAMHVLGQFWVPVDAAVIGVIDRIDFFDSQN